MSGVTAASGERLEVVFWGGLVRPLLAHRVDAPELPVRFHATCWVGHRRVLGARLLGADGQVLDRVGETSLDRRVEVPLDPDSEWRRGHGAGPVGDAVLSVVGGTSSCGWEEVLVLRVGWPLDGPGDREVRQYVRDPNGSLADRTAATFGADVELPAAAAWTEYGRADADLWADPSTADTRLYVVTLDRVEQWPRLETPLTCLE